jgi:hypothetical protein
MSDEEWRIGIRSTDEPDKFAIPGFAKLQLEQNELFGREVIYDGSRYVKENDIEENDESPEASETAQENERSFEQIEKEIEEAREQTSQAFAKRMKVGFFRKKKKAELQTELNEKKSLLAELTEERNAVLVKKLHSENLNDEQIVEKVVELANSEAELSSKSQRDAMIGSKFYQKKWNEFNEVYANLSRPAKIGAAVLTGFGLVIAGSAASTLAFPGAVLLAGTRMAKTYYMNRSKLYSASETPPKIDCKNEDGTLRDLDTVLMDAKNNSLNAIDSRIDRGDKIKRNATLATLGSVALIGVGAYAEHSDTINHVAAKVKDNVGDAFRGTREWFGSLNGGGSRSVDMTFPEQPGAGSGVHDALDSGSGAGAPGGTFGTSEAFGDMNQPLPSSMPEMPSAMPEGGVDSGYYDFFNVSQGEGWYQTFNEAGVTNATDRANLLNNDVLMSKLANMNLAYVDHSLGGWGLNMPADGKLPNEALTLIREAAINSRMSVN